MSGWICPKCNKVYGPSVEQCRMCNLLNEVPKKPQYTNFRRGDWVAFHNAPGNTITTDNPKFDTLGTLLVVYVSPNTLGVEVTDENGVHGVVDRMNLRHTPFVSKTS